MRKVLVFVPERFSEIPNLYFKNLVNSVISFAPKGYSIESCGSNNVARKLKKGASIVFCPRGYGIELVAKYCNKRNIPIISQMDDLHYHNSETKEKRHFLFSKSDVILLSYYDHFLKIKEYKAYADKAVNFPFHYPGSLELLDKNSAKEDKILLTGRCSSSYPLRRKILKIAKKYPDKFETLQHPGYFGLKHQIIGDNYYKFISNFKASIATSAAPPIDYPVLKYFEIPMCNVLPIFEKIDTLKSLGFVSGKHYVEINKNKLEKSLINLNLSSFNDIKNNARDLILNNHMPEHRMKRFFEAIDAII